MAENVVINIEANTSGLQSTIDLMVKLGLVSQDSAEKFNAANEKKLQELQKAAGQTKKTFDDVAKSIDNIKKDNGIAKALDVTAPLVKATNQTQSLKAQLKEATVQAQQLADQYGELDSRTLEAARAASELRQKVEDSNRVIKALDPGEKFNTIRNFASAIGGAFQVATGALQAFGVENKKAQEIAQQFQGALNIFAGLQQLAELKDTFIALKAAMGVSTVATTAQTVALEGEAAAAAAGTAANQTFAASLSASGIGAIVLVIGALAAGMYALSTSTDDSADATTRLKNATEGLVQAQKDLAAARKGEQDADLALLVSRGKITAADAQRQQLTRDSTEIYKQKSREIALADQNQIKAKKDLEAAEKAVAEAKKFTGAGAAAARTAADERLKVAQDEVNATGKLYKTLVEDRTLTQLEYIKKAVLSKEEEAKAFKEAEQRKRDEIAKTNKAQEGKKPAKKETLPEIKPVQPVEIPIGVTFKDPQSEDIFNDVINPATVPTREIPYTATLNVPPNFSKDEKELLTEAGVQAAGEVAQAWVDAWSQAAQARNEAVLKAFDEESTANDDALKRRLITKEEYDKREGEISEQRAKKEREIKRRAAIIQKEEAIFGIALKTAEALVAAWLNPLTATVSTATVLTIAGIETAAVLAKPIPRYKKGTLSVPGHGSEDTVPAILAPGEAVIPTEMNKKYHSAVKAIYSGTISPKDLNDFVNSRNNNQGSGMSTSDVYMLTKAINKNNRVNIGNLDELARHISSLNNPRR